MSKKSKTFSKERQALDELYDVAGIVQNLKEDYIILKSALQRLEAIDNAKPSEALNELEELLLSSYSYIIMLDRFNNAYPIIKQSLLKAQELESENNALLEENKDLYVELAFSEKQYKELIEFTNQYKRVLEIIFEKNVDILELRILIEHYNDKVALSMYNSKVGKELQLTEEEFDTLKRWQNEITRVKD